jgi:DNA (cytosine-5)-methyltransferase 1
MAVAITAKTFTYIELFAGIGGFRQALDTLGGECVFASEIDPFATRAYKALYGGASELHGDITKIDADSVPDHDVLVGGFPCQAFSVAGQRKGFEDTRGTLFFEIARIANAKKPRLMLLENVKGLLSHDDGNTFDTMCAALNDIGYAIDFRVLNSKHFGVPQNRERIFIVANRDAVHDPWILPKSSDVVTRAKRRATEAGVRTFNFNWPVDGAVITRLRDVLETDVDEKYYLSDEKTAKLVVQLNNERDGDVVFIGGIESGTRRMNDGKSYSRNFRQGNRVYDSTGVATTLTSQSVGGLGGHTSLYAVSESDSPNVAGSLEHYGNDQMNRVYSVDGVAPTITVVSGGGREQKIAEPQVSLLGNTNPSGRGMNGSVYDSAGLSPTLTTNKGEGVKVCVEYSRKEGIGKELEQAHCLSASDWRGLNRNQAQTAVMEVRPVLTPDREEKRQNGRRFKADGEDSVTLTAQDKHGIAIGTYPRYRIRKLTPLECWRLQGFSDEAHDTVKLVGISDSQRYKQAGNAVTVNVINAIGKRLISLLPVTDVKEAA